MVRAWAIASQASQSPAKPRSQRTGLGSLDQAAGPRASALPPPNSQQAVASHHSPAVWPTWTRLDRLTAHNKASKPPVTSATALESTPFNLAHSQPAALINPRLSKAKGSGLATHSAGNSSASSTKAVITR